VAAHASGVAAPAAHRDRCAPPGGTHRAGMTGNKKPAVSRGFFVSRVVASAALQDQTCIAFATSAA
jgi:hypothetical protein